MISKIEKTVKNQKPNGRFPDEPKDGLLGIE